jgi:cytochrome P450
MKRLTSRQMTGSDSFDPMTPANVQDPFAFFSRLREEKPVYWNEQYSFWMLTRYRDVKAILRAPSQFSSATGSEIEKRGEQLPASARASFDIGKRFLYTTLQALDPPKHTDQRRTVMNAFTPQLSTAMRMSIQQRVDRLVEDIERREICDFVSDFAYPLSSFVIFDLLGVPTEHHDSIRQSSQAAASFTSAVHRRDFEAMEHIAERLTDAEKVLQRLIAERRHKPGNDLISHLLQRPDTTAWLPDDELVVLCNFLLIAGQETTANLLSGSLRHLLERRELWQQLGADPGMIPAAVEELLRFVSPVLWVSRLPTEDVELDGKLLRKGNRLQLGIGAANHDPSEFPNPEQLDFTRPKVNSLAFGYGPHFCLGAALARTETQIALSRLLERIPHIRLGVQHFEYRPLYIFRALKSLPVIVRNSSVNSDASIELSGA